MPTWDDFAKWAQEQAAESGGRKALRRRWIMLRELAAEVAARLSAGEIEVLLGKPLNQLDPEQNDLKALVAYAIGRGIVADATRLQDVLRHDTCADPLHFLALHSGKTFGERFAPLIARFWLAEPRDEWEKQSSSGLYDVGWTAHERLGKEIRIELKASSEQPNFLFQQIRHPKMSGGPSDYDLLLCLGVTAGSLEWWAIPSADLHRFADTGATHADRVVITRHHGKRRSIWNAQQGYSDEGWFRTDCRARGLLAEYSLDSESLRSGILSRF